MSADIVQRCEIERLRAENADLIAALKTLAVYYPDICDIVE